LGVADEDVRASRIRYLRRMEPCGAAANYDDGIRFSSHAQNLAQALLNW
jgi:hypothetical protein